MKSLILVCFCAGWFGWGGFGGSHFDAAIGDPPNASEQDGAERDDIGNVSENAVGKFGHGFGGLIGTIAEFFERNAREKQDGSTTDFVKSINVIYVIAGIVVEALLGFGDKRIAFAKFCGACGTDCGAGGGLAFGDQVRAHITFAN